MAPRLRGRHRKNKMVGNTRMDAALDAMRPFGFDEQLVRETVDELLDVYEGSQGWPFIEEASYKLLIETILASQSSSKEEKDNAGRDGDTETSSAATPTTGITEAGSSNPAAQDSLLLQTGDGLDSASQTDDQDRASLGNLETDVKDSTVSAERGGGNEQGNGVLPKNELKPVDNDTGRNHSTFVRSIGSAVVSPVIQSSSQPPENLPFHRRKPFYGWIGDDEDVVDLICFPLPPLPEHVERLIGQSAAPQTRSGGRRRRKSRWDEKPDDM